jgi:fructoselysine-6-P-deglycase FrlB-like protein
LARPYKSEMAELGATLDWVAQADLSAILASLERARYEPFITVGSGGSLSAAYHLARLQTRFHRRLSAAMTPYEFRAGPIPEGAHCWIFSAGGSNVDVIAAVTAANRAEPAGVNAVTMRRRSALSRLADGNPAMRLHYLPAPSKKDGFLATNSLLAFCSIMTRAYLEMHGDVEVWQQIVAQLHRHIEGDYSNAWRAAALDVSGLQHLVVLHDAHTSLGAFDLESKLTEAGIVGVQLADYRHFAHGRHHWLAKNGRVSGVLALSSDGDRSLARRTLRLLPKDTPRAIIDVPGPGESAQLASLLAAFYITEELSFSRGIDPGQPGVPEFGRKLYNLNLGKVIPRTRLQVSVDRKRSVRPTPRDPDAREVSEDNLAAAHRVFEEHLAATPLGGIVLDYDGTVVDTPDRFQPPRGDLVAEMLRILHGRLPLGVATGRGRSAGRDLRAVIPKELWGYVTIGYYNGAVIRELADTGALDEPSHPSEELGLIHDTLQRDDSGLKLTLRQHQLTVEAEGGLPEDRLWERVRALVDGLKLPLLRVLRSSHSIDVLDSSGTKLNVVDTVATLAKTPSILRIGDRGRWPGNDYELLASPMGLSVDQVGPDLSTCWNIAPEGLRGSRATLYYLRSVGVLDGLGWLRPEHA